MFSLDTFTFIINDVKAKTVFSWDVHVKVTFAQIFCQGLEVIGMGSG